MHVPPEEGYFTGRCPSAKPTLWDDLVLMAESEELLVEKIRRWKAGMEEKGLRV